MLPTLVFLAPLALHHGARLSFPPSVRDLANGVDRLDRQPVRRGDELRRRNRPLHRRGVDRYDRLIGKARAQSPSLLFPFVGKENVDTASESIFGGQLGRAVTDEVDAGGHTGSIGWPGCKASVRRVGCWALFCRAGY